MSNLSKETTAEINALLKDIDIAMCKKHGIEYVEPVDDEFVLIDDNDDDLMVDENTLITVKN